MASPHPGADGFDRALGWCDQNDGPAEEVGETIDDGAGDIKRAKTEDATD